MDYQKFAQELPTLYQDWGLSSLRPLSEQFCTIQTQINSTSTANLLPLLNLAVDCLEEEEIYCQIGFSDGAMLIGSLINHPEQIAYLVDNFALENEQHLPSLENLTYELSLFNLAEQVICYPQNFEEFFADLKEIAPETKIGVYFYNAASDYRSQLLSLLLVKPFLSERALIIINNSNYGMVQQATYDFLASNSQADLLLDLSTPSPKHCTFDNGLYLLNWNQSNNKIYNWKYLSNNWRNSKVINNLKNCHQQWEFIEKKQTLELLAKEGKSLLLQNQIEAARDKLNRALEYNKYAQELWYSLAISYYKEGDYSEAVNLMQKALQYDWSNPQYHYDLAIILEKMGQYQNAINAYQNTISLDKFNLDAYNNLGNIYYNNGEIEQAKVLYQQSLEINPEYFGSLMNVGKIYLVQKNFDLAIETYQKALNLQPNNPDILYNLGLAHEKNKDYSRANLYFGEAAFFEQKYQEAIKFYHKYLENNLGESSLYLHLAEAYTRINDLENAIKTYRYGITHYRTDCNLYYWLVRTLQNFGRVTESINTANEALNIVHNKILFSLENARQVPIVYNTTAEIDFYRQRFSQELLKSIKTCFLQSEEDNKNALEAITYHTNFYLAYQGKNDLELQSIYGNFVAQVMAANYPQWATISPNPELTKVEKIRIGYISYGLCHHVVGKLAVGWVKNQNRQKFEIYCYYLGNGRADQITAQFKIDSDIFRQLPDDNLELICKQIREDNLQILVYLDIGMYPKITALAGLRLAPIQCTTWFHPVTSGLPTIDYFLSSDLMEPENGDEHYSEKLIRLPNLGICYAHPILPKETKGRDKFQLAQNKIVYLCSQSMFKYLPQYDYIFPSIAQKVPDCQFVFIESNQSSELTAQFKKRLEKAFASLDLNYADFCVIVSRMDSNDYLNLNLVSDIFLDSFSWSGGKTTLEAIACNLPVVTCPGEFMRGRHSYGILKMLGVEDTIAYSEQEYIDIAVRLALDSQWRTSIVEKIKANQERVFEDKTCVVALEEFFKQVVEVQI